MTFKCAQIFCGTNLGYNNNFGTPKTFYKNAHVHKINTNKKNRKGKMKFELNHIDQTKVLNSTEEQ